MTQQQTNCMISFTYLFSQIAFSVKKILRNTTPVGIQSLIRGFGQLIYLDGALPKIGSAESKLKL